MLRAIELGKKALGIASPNPMVGCVIVHDEKIIGEGYTSRYGGAHAEVNAINSVINTALLNKATLYVTLEPCSHYGKTPPCADLIAKHKIPKVVVALRDPNDKVAGAGLKKLKATGCEVVMGVLEKESRRHHKRFLTFQEKKRPYIILKWAETQDGFIAPDTKKRKENPEPYWISNQYSRQLVHQWRSEEMAILVGTNTVLQDNPKLTLRTWAGKSPTRIVLDRNLKITDNFHVLDGNVKTLIFTEKKIESSKTNVIYETVSFDNDLVKQLCKIVHRHHINSVIVEGGSRTLQTFIDANLWDEARIFKGNTLFKDGIVAPKINGKLYKQQQISTDTLTYLTND
jgi:diaminohydroxyphosphoribosylaminopyrimidine deaminase/5-amino-6-(5-phosphoribosylamino)uracil reductase